MKSYQRLNLEEYQRLCVMKDRSFTVQMIADVLRRSKSSVRSSEITTERLAIELPSRKRDW